MACEPLGTDSVARSLTLRIRGHNHSNEMTDSVRPERTTTRSESPAGKKNLDRMHDAGPADG